MNLKERKKKKKKKENELMLQNDPRAYSRIKMSLAHQPEGPGTRDKGRYVGEGGGGPVGRWGGGGLGDTSSEKIRLVAWELGCERREGVPSLP